MLTAFDRYSNNPQSFENYDYTNNRDKHITKVLSYMIIRIEELINDVNTKEQHINILGMQVDHLTAQMNQLADHVKEAVNKQDLEALTAIDRWLSERKNDKRNSTERLP